MSNSNYQPHESPESKLRDYENAQEALSRRGVPTHGENGDYFSLFKRISVYSQGLEKYPLVKDPPKGNRVEEGGPLVVVKETKQLVLSSDQEKAWKKLQVWLKNKNYYFVLKGFAGTGKTHLMKMISDTVVDRTIYFTAPTNKAAKVLGKMLGRGSKTIHSLLGLKMSNDGDKMVLVWPDKPPDLSRECLIVVDEAGMVNEQLQEFIDMSRASLSAKVLFVGDPAQLPPVGEDDSSCWHVVDESSDKAMLKEVMRFDNQLLKLATHLRDCVRTDRKPNIEDDNDGTEGVFVCREKKFWKELLPEDVKPSDFLEKKVIAWRNKTVDAYNKRIREHLGFGDTVYHKGDLLLLATPLESFGTIIATVDEELTVERVADSTVSLKSYDIPVYELLCRNDSGQILKLNVPTEDDLVLQTLLSEMSEKARRTKNKIARNILWKEFFEAKNSFPSVRYAFALTAHRIEGSTLTKAFVDSGDILANRDTNIAYRCLYVAATRPTSSVYIL